MGYTGYKLPKSGQLLRLNKLLLCLLKPAKRILEFSRTMIERLFSKFAFRDVVKHHQPANKKVVATVDGAKGHVIGAPVIPSSK